jgi:protein ImuB
MTRPAELYACFYAKELPAQALLRLRPELRTRPCVVLDGDPPTEQVCALNARARQVGLVHGMTRVEVETFPEAVVLPRSQPMEATAKTILLECAGAFSPRVEDGSRASAFLCGIDIAGTENLFGPPEILARLLLDRTKALGILGCVAVSRNLHAAECAAKGQSRGRAQVMAPGEEALALAPLPLSVLDLTADQAETFSLWGIRTLGRLAELPERELISRMGQTGKRLRQLARGEMAHLFQPIEPVFTLEEQIELDSPVEQLESLLFVIGLMLDQLIVRARTRILALAAVTITLKLEGGASHTRTVRPALPSNEKQLWLKLLHLDLEAHPPQAAILAAALQAEPGSTNKVQLGLFSPQLPEAARLDVTLARIRAIVGEGNVGRAVLQDTHAQDAFRIEPFAVLSERSAVKTSTESRVAMRKLRPPESTAVMLQDARPVAFFFRDRRYQVERGYGPWLTEGEWWNPSLWGFEQWDLIARASDGSMLCCCLMRDLLQDEWQIAGLYD